ncbi:MAG: hypothetical protein IKL52_06890 [Candidatus Gastranaerophilales bacterium]|nr:hypothetical protein [Candidatus Gastranaerophilales bacterium]
MDSENKDLVSYQFQNNKIQNAKYTLEEAIKEFDELKNIALSCFDKNGNPNVSAALRAIENKAKIAGLYSAKQSEITNIVKMGEITIDGQQLKLDIGEEFS